MQYLLPPAKDVRKYLYFYDDASSIDFTSVSELRDVIRSTRATVKSQAGSTLSTYRMMGAVASGSGQRVHYARIGFLSEDPDFSTDRRFIDTLLHPGRGASPRTEIDLLDNTNPFPSGGSGELEGPIWFRPARVGKYTYSNGTMSFPSLQSSATSPSQQYAASWVHWRKDIGPTSATSYNSTVCSWAYTQDGNKVFAVSYTNANAYAFKWSPYFSIGGQNRASVPTRSDTSVTPNAMSTVQTFAGGTESAIKLTKGLLAVDEGSALRIVKLSSADGDFTHGGALPGVYTTVSNVNPIELYGQNAFSM